MEKNNEGLDKLKKLVEEVKVAMLCTRHEDHLHARPMSTSQIDQNGDIWFFTNEFSGKIDQIENDPHVCLAYADPADSTYVAVRGDASLVNDQAKIKELWNPILKAWFPDGLDDPKLSLLKVTPTDAEFWDSSSSKMINFFNIVKAAVTGGKTDVGDHGKINL